MSTSPCSPTRAAFADDSAEQPLPSLWETATFRNWGRTLFWTLATVSVCGAFYVLDKWGLDGTPRLVEYRMFKNPTTLPMIVLGIPHFIIAFAFAITSRRMREPRNRLVFAGLAVIGTGFCWLFYRVGAGQNPFAVFLFYFYFLIHGFRDDAFFYRAYGDMPREAAAAHQRIMGVLQLLMLGLLFALFWPAYTVMAGKSYRVQDPILQNFFPSDWPFTLRLASMFAPMAIIAVAALRRIGRAFPDGLRGLWRTHRPILAVFCLELCIVLLALLGGPGAFDVIVTMHFVGWFLFALYSLRRAPVAASPRSSWVWMRSTPRGFATLHVSLAAVVMALIAVSVYGYGKDCFLETFVGHRNFYYWTIMHVTLSFLPR